ncbi:M23 family metallopeptidase [Streptomyces sp. MAR4 CNX-425]|uniref:M23 family metallopeptidase n=1 Tax=Streptomyces sp. MAR4 CNX-425 TaxID=3406343 RepID=UPI003B510CE2
MSRASLTVTASGAGLALPLVAGAAAPAASAPADAVHSPAKGRAQDGRAAPPEGGLSGRAAAEAAEDGDGAAPQGGRAGTVDKKPGHHEVAAGETLSGIADQHRVRGGWPALYERNRGVVGSDPDLILPGQRLTLRGGAAAPPRPREDSPAGTGRPAGGEAEPEQDGAGDKTTDRAGAGTQQREKPKPRKAKPERTKPERTKPDTKRRAAAPQADAKPKAEPKPKPRAEPQGSPDYTSPLAGAGIGTAYGVRGSSWSSGYHTGVDFPVSVGTGVRSVADGEVVSAGWAGAYGYEVVIRHRDGRYSQYAHLSAITVSAGRPVNAGQRIGRSGSTGNSTGPHLHFEVRTGPGYGSDIDPLRYLRAHGVRI